MTPIEINGTTLRDALIKSWMSDLGERETHGKNRSPMIDGFNKRMKVPLGSPYCIGALLCRMEAVCKSLGLKNPVVMTAGTQAFYNSAPAKYKHPRGTRAQRGDICILVNNANPTQGHAYGLTRTQALPDHTQYTIEYNTSPAGSRDGDGVYQLTRTQKGTASKKYRGAVDVVRWILDANGL